MTLSQLSLVNFNFSPQNIRLKYLDKLLGDKRYLQRWWVKISTLDLREIFLHKVHAISIFKEKLLFL